MHGWIFLYKSVPGVACSKTITYKAFQRQIEATDGQINALVYELYGLTEEEIRIVEGKCI
jgi:hypothetical protein